MGTQTPDDPVTNATQGIAILGKRSSDNTLQFISSDDYSSLAIALGKDPNITAVDKFGKNDTVGTSFEEIWAYSSNITYIPNATAETITIASSGVDTVGNTGARTVVIEGLDATGAEISETVVLNAAASPTSANQYWRINRAYCVLAGTGGINANDILFTASGSGVQANIKALEGQTMKTQATIPLGKTGFISGLFFNMGKSDDAVVQIQTRKYGESWRTKRELKGYQNHVQLLLPSFIAVDALGDIRMLAKTGAGGLAVAAGYYYYLEDLPV